MTQAWVVSLTNCLFIFQNCRCLKFLFSINHCNGWNLPGNCCWAVPAAGSGLLQWRYKGLGLVGSLLVVVNSWLSAEWPGSGEVCSKGGPLGKGQLWKEMRKKLDVRLKPCRDLSVLEPSWTLCLWRKISVLLLINHHGKYVILLF